MTAYTLDDVVAALARHQRRATYGAVAGFLGRPATFVMQGRPRDALHSWVVNAETGEPTGYAPPERDPHLFRHAEVLRNPGEVALLVANVDVVRRRAFARFLERLARHETTEGEWDVHVIEHYQDQLLEAVRAECVRALFDADDRLRPSPDVLAQLQAWAVALLGSVW